MFNYSNINDTFGLIINNININKTTDENHKQLLLSLFYKYSLMIIPNQDIGKKDLINVDEAIISPGLDKSHKVFKILKDLNINIITDIDLFKRSNSIPIISITGTNGKTTIVNMLQHVLNNIGINSIACGNNGISPLLIPSSQYKYIILE